MSGYTVGQLLQGESVFLRDAHDRGVDLALGGAHFGAFDHPVEDLRLDQSLETLGAHQGDLGFREPRLPHPRLEL